MGKFNDTKYINTIDKLVSAEKSKLDNPYYMFSDQAPTKVTYYAQNIEKSTLDEASGLYESHLDKQSSFKFNKINDFVLYGIERISSEYDVGDNGIEASTISGNAIVLPNTIYPKPGDYFRILYLKEKLLFKVVGVSIDTLDTGANIYKLEYTLGNMDDISSIESKVEKRYNFLINNVGTDYKTILQDCDYDLITNLQDLIEYMIICFNNIFFDSKLQTYVYNHDGWNMYDPYIIEFIMRNKIMDFGDKYIFIAHATSTHKTFGMDYSKTFFHALEEKELNNASCIATADLITDANSLFYTKIDEYYAIKYNDNDAYKTRFYTIDPEVIDRIRTNTMFDKEDKNEYFNLWIAYFNDNDTVIRGDILQLLKTMDYTDNTQYFYSIIISIFILERSIKKLLK